MEEPQHQAGLRAASAGRQGASRKPALPQLDQDTLNTVVAKLEPEVLAIAGSCKHRTCLHTCLRRGCLAPEAKQGGRFGVQELDCLMNVVAFSLQQGLL